MLSVIRFLMAPVILLVAGLASIVIWVLSVMWFATKYVLFAILFLATGFVVFYGFLFILASI